MFPCVQMGVFPTQEQSFTCYDCMTFLLILANFASDHSHPCVRFKVTQAQFTNTQVS